MRTQHPGTLHPSNLKTSKRATPATTWLKLVIKEEVLPATDQPRFQSLELLAGRGLLAPDTWKCKRAQVSLKATIDVPMLGTIIEENGDGLWKIPTCLWDGHSTSMALSDNAVFTELLAYKN